MNPTVQLWYGLLLVAALVNIALYVYSVRRVIPAPCPHWTHVVNVALHPRQPLCI